MNVEVQRDLVGRLLSVGAKKGNSISMARFILLYGQTSNRSTHLQTDGQLRPDYAVRNFFGLRLCVELQAGKLRMRGCSCLMNFDLLASFMSIHFLAISKLPKGHSSVYLVAGLVPARKIYVHCEVEVHMVCQRLFKKLAKAYAPCNTFCMLILALYRLHA